MIPQLKFELDHIFQKAIDPKTTDNYASALRRKARTLLITAHEPKEHWPAWVDEGVHWQEPVDRNERPDYPPDLEPSIVDALERFREQNNPAQVRIVCRSLNIPPPGWAVR